MSCAVKSCKNYKRLLPPDSNISFHGFPRNEETYKTWLNAIGVEKYIPWRPSLLVCSKHFNNQDVVRLGSRRYLRPDAVPCRYLVSDIVPEDHSKKEPMKIKVYKKQEKEKPRDWKYCKNCSSGKLLKKKDVNYTVRYLADKNKLYRTHKKATRMSKKLQNIKMEASNGVIPKTQLHEIKYTDPVLKFALTLNHYYPAAYWYFRTVFRAALPSVVSSRKKIIKNKIR